MWVGLAVLSVLAILLLNFSSEVIPGKGFDSTGSFMILGLFAFAMLRLLRVPTIEYFGKPVLGWKFLAAMVFTVNLIIVQIRGEGISLSDRRVVKLLKLCAASALLPARPRALSPGPTPLPRMPHCRLFTTNCYAIAPACSRRMTAM